MECYKCSMYPNQAVLERFWAKVYKTEDCWIWLGPASSLGYGSMGVEGKVVRVHRVSFEIHFGPIPKEMVVMHICDNRICVRPDHLKLGTRAENLADCRAKGRWHNHVKEKREPVGRRGKTPSPPAERFWPKADIKSDKECWNWTGGINFHGYGRFFMPGLGRVPAHRMAYLFSTGEIIPDGLVVMHTCDNRRCVNPGHLRLGTVADNNQDRGRKKRGREHRQKGDDNPGTKIKDAELPRIFLLREEGWSQQKIANEFSVSQAQISKILLGQSRTGY